MNFLSAFSPRTTLSCRLLGAAVLALCSLSAQAQISNGGFNTDLSGWTLHGDASLRSGGAPEGAGQLWLGSDALADPGSLNLSGNDPLAAGGPLEAALGLSAGALDTLDGAAFEGSLAGQSFTAQAGEVLSFQWNFSTSENSSDPALADYGFVVVDGTLYTLASVADASQSASFAGYLGDTGVQQFSLALTSSGSHQLYFGVVDLGDYTVGSALAVDAVQVSASPVPEPQPAALLLAGLGGLMLWRRPRR